LAIDIQRGEEYLNCFSFFFVLRVLKKPPLINLQDEEMVSDPGQLLEEVLASHDVRIEDGQYSNTCSLFIFKKINISRCLALGLEGNFLPVAVQK